MTCPMRSCQVIDSVHDSRMGLPKRNCFQTARDLIHFPPPIIESSLSREELIFNSVKCFR